MQRAIRLQHESRYEPGSPGHPTVQHPLQSHRHPRRLPIPAQLKGTTDLPPNAGPGADLCGRDVLGGLTG